MEPDDEFVRESLSPQITSLISAAGEQTLTIAEGHFQLGEFASAANAHGATAGQYRGVQILSFKDTSVAFIDSSTALIGDPEIIRAALERKEAPAPTDIEQSAKMRELGEAYDAWFFSTGPLAEFFADRIADQNLGDAMHGNLLSAI